MSATELIEKVKALPAAEQEAFARLFRQLAKRGVPVVRNAGNQAPKTTRPDFGARLKRIYGEKVVADSEVVVSYARGE